MKISLKSEKGISLVSLVITVIIILSLTVTIIYNSQDSIDIQYITNLYNDLELLRGKVLDYYEEYNDIPIKSIYKNTKHLDKLLTEEEKNSDFYVIDLEALKGVTLNYGKDYEKIKKDESKSDDYTDLYVINKYSHNIFYIKGIKLENEEDTYYTDYATPDNTKIDLRYIDGKLIPRGYTGRKENDKIIIKNNENSMEYTWKEEINEINKIPEGITLLSTQSKSDFIKSVNYYGGYFINKSEVVYIDINIWSEPYKNETEYEDELGDIVKIPKGYSISLSPIMDTIKNGLVIKDHNGNEFVWIDVPRKITQNAKNTEEIENSLKEYVKKYKKDNLNENYNGTDKWYSGCGIFDETEYNKTKETMLNSIKNNGGFWISRYEFGVSSARTSTSTDETEDVGIKQDLYAYNYVTVSQAQKLAKDIAMKDSNKTSSLMFGIQWDLVCAFIEKNTNLLYDDISENSDKWANYKTATFDITSSNAKQYISSWGDADGVKQENQSVLLSTGATEYTNILNIYDFAGNVSEYTLEYTGNSNMPVSLRGGQCAGTYAAASRGMATTNNSTIGDGFRIALY